MNFLKRMIFPHIKSAKDYQIMKFAP